ncbi:hypothetical protein THTE_0508 [Thermogutta terrifontis]|uniref:Uncharacterized protein n=1 Tax=Thermogutta terrifontis TaxID=1331910 RepID=A0A286RAX5_9BACT|nr:hypothetical protein THTE_0508 [Thermogutta terrifontis]
MSGPPFDSMECGDLSPLFGEGFSLHHLGVDPDGNGLPVAVEPDPPIHTMEVHIIGGTRLSGRHLRRDVLVTPASPRRDLLVRSAV